ARAGRAAVAEPGEQKPAAENRDAVEAAVGGVVGQEPGARARVRKRGGRLGRQEDRPPRPGGPVRDRHLQRVVFAGELVEANVGGGGFVPNGLIPAASMGRAITKLRTMKTRQTTISSFVWLECLLEPRSKTSSGVPRLAISGGSCRAAGAKAVVVAVVEADI